MKIYICLMMALLATAKISYAQYAYFPAEGTIEYDKTVHVQNLLKRHISVLKDDVFSKKYYENLLEKVDETVVLKKKLSFRGDEMNLESIEQTLPSLMENLLEQGLLDYQPTVYQNLKTAVSKSSFDLGGSPVLIQDSLLQIKWKITDEYRDIAGYRCRRANGVTLDSVYVVAFYTDQIPTSAGPGAVHGLPGMILGLVVPEQHYNIYATKVDFNQPVIKANVGGKRDTPMTRKETQKKLKEVMGRWMSDEQFNLVIASMFL